MVSDPKKKKTFQLFDRLWDIWCIVSVVGIWPRFIEPNLLATTRLTLPIKQYTDDLKNFRILQFSDLHMGPHVTNRQMERLQRRIEKLKPDIIVFTGDFLCYSKLSGRDRLKTFLSSLQAPYGCYAIFGNHDYEKSVAVNELGDYDILEMESSKVAKGFKRLFSPLVPTGKATAEALALKEHQELRYLLNDTPFELLNNRCKTIKVKNTKLNLLGVGEHMLGRCKPEKAFVNYIKEAPGIILAHNPDAVPHLLKYPGDVILCGHTHGAQINLPWIWKKFMISENMQYKRGLFRVQDRWVYVNRGVGSVMPFRWFSVPEVLLLTLSAKK